MRDATISRRGFVKTATAAAIAVGARHAFAQSMPTTTRVDAPGPMRFLWFDNFDAVSDGTNVKLEGTEKFLPANPEAVAYKTMSPYWGKRAASWPWHSTLGIDVAAAQLLGRDRPIFGGSRAYLSAAARSFKEDADWQAAMARMGNYALINVWTEPKHYDVASQASGAQDAIDRAFLDGLDFTGGKRYLITKNHEPEYNFPQTDENIALWRAGSARFVTTCARWASEHGIPPRQLGVGGLLTITAMGNDAKRDKYAWWRDVDKVHAPWAVYFCDTYVKFRREPDGSARAEDLTDRVTPWFEDVRRSSPIARLAIAETTLGRDVRGEDRDVDVGTDAQLAAFWREQVPRLKAIDGLECLAGFSKPGGTNSRRGQPRGESLRAVAEMALTCDRSTR